MATKQFYYRRTAPCLEKFPFCTHFSITDFQMCEKREHTRSCSKREEVCNMDFGDCWKPANWILEQYDFLAELKSTNGQRTISLLLSTSVLDTLIAEEQRYSYWTIAFIATILSLIVKKNNSFNTEQYSVDIMTILWQDKEYEMRMWYANISQFHQRGYTDYIY